MHSILSFFIGLNHLNQNSNPKDDYENEKPRVELDTHTGLLFYDVFFIDFEAGFKDMGHDVFGFFPVFLCHLHQFFDLPDVFLHQLLRIDPQFIQQLFKDIGKQDQREGDQYPPQNEVDLEFSFMKKMSEEMLFIKFPLLSVIMTSSRPLSSFCFAHKTSHGKSGNVFR